jgi:hypothetical protein
LVDAVVCRNRLVEVAERLLAAQAERAQAPEPCASC